MRANSASFVCFFFLSFLFYTFQKLASVVLAERRVASTTKHRVNPPNTIRVAFHTSLGHATRTATAKVQLVVYKHREGRFSLDSGGA